MGSYIAAAAVVTLLSIPLGLTGWALLDAARRPAWAWSMAERSQAGWITGILMGALMVPVGLAISGYYLVRIRPQVARVEAGDLSR